MADLRVYKVHSTPEIDAEDARLIARLVSELDDHDLVLITATPETMAHLRQFVHAAMSRLIHQIEEACIQANEVARHLERRQTNRCQRKEYLLHP